MPFLNSLNANRANTWFKRLQLVSSAAFSIGHGGNDAQKVIGIIMAALIAYNPTLYSLDHMVWWVPLALLRRYRARHYERRLENQ